MDNYNSIDNQIIRLENKLAYGLFTSQHEVQEAQAELNELYACIKGLI